MNELELVNIIIDLMRFIERNGLMLNSETSKHITEVFERRLNYDRI